MWSSRRPVCLIALLFSFVGHASVSFGTVCPDFCLNKWIWICQCRTSELYLITSMLRIRNIRLGDSLRKLMSTISNCKWFATFESVALRTFLLLLFRVFGCRTQRQETLALVLTILDMQPRQTGGGTGKSSDTIVYEMAAGILEKVIDKLDIDEAKADMFEVSKEYSVHCSLRRKKAETFHSHHPWDNTTTKSSSDAPSV